MTGAEERCANPASSKLPTWAARRRPRLASTSVHHERTQIMQWFSICVQVFLFHIVQTVLPLPLGMQRFTFMAINKILCVLWCSLSRPVCCCFCTGPLTTTMDLNPRANIL